MLQLLRRGKPSARQVARARILLKAAEGLTDEQIVRATDASGSTVRRVRQRVVDEGLEAAVSERPRPGQPPRLDGRQQAHVVALACRVAPEGHTHGTLRLLADRVVELGLADAISHETGRRGLNKTPSSRGGTGRGAFPPWERSS